MATDKPRHIRDIAHLYLSRMRSLETPAPRRQVIVAGLGPECFPAFHLANIAAAMSSLGQPVRVVERSGLLANTAFFLSLPPEVYIGAGSRSVPTSVSALGGVKVSFPGSESGDGREAADVLGQSRDVVDLFHFPPTADPADLTRNAADCAVASGKRVVLLIGPSEDVGLANWSEGLEATAKYLLITDHDSKNDRHGVDVIGTVGRWESALVDSIPPVLRDSGSRLARAYGLIASRLLSQLSSTKEKNEHSTAPPDRAAGFGAR